MALKRELPAWSSVAVLYSVFKLVGPNDVGMIRAEFMIGYWVSDKTMIRLGLTSLNTEYKTATELQAGNSRFRANSQIPFIAITYSPKHN